MTYVDGVILPVPVANKDKYIALAKQMAGVFRRFGALKVIEIWGEDLPDGEVTSFPMAVKLEEGETVVMAMNIWPSKEARDKGWEQAMADPVFSGDGGDMPFDGKRMIFGEFETIIDA
ncbi:MAG: DUF1428 domain-containing protein [Pseudomonadota bacterium]